MAKHIFKCLYCNSPMKLESKPCGEVEEGFKWHYLQCTQCLATGPQFCDSIDISKVNCIRKAFESMTIPHGYRITLVCSKCILECSGQLEDIHKECPLPDCNGTLHKIPEEYIH